MLDVALLGTLEVRRDGRRVDLRGPRQRALLAALALHGPAIVPAARLIDLLWPAGQPKHPANALAWQVAQLRRTVGTDAIVTRDPGYALVTLPERIDAHRFEHLVDDARGLEAADPRRAQRMLRSALRLWRGSALMDVPDDVQFTAEANRLEERRLIARERLVSIELEVGEPADAVLEAERLLADHPYRERLHALRMRALYAAGRQADALAAFHQARRALDEHLGVETAPELRELERAILRQDDAVLLRRGTFAGASTVHDPAPRLPVIVVVEEDGKLAALLDVAVPLACSGHPHELLVARVLPRSAGAGVVGEETSRLAGLRAQLARAGVAARVAAFTSADWSTDVLRLLADPRVDLALLPAPMALASGRRVDDRLERVLTEAPCDVALLRVALAERPDDGAPVLVAFAGGRHDWAALEIGAWIAAAERRPLRVGGAAAGAADGRTDATRLLAVASLAAQELVGVVAEPVVVPADPHQLAAAGAGCRVLLLPFGDAWRGGSVGAFRSAVVRAASPPVLLVRCGARASGLAPVDGPTRYSWSGGSARDRAPSPA